MNLPLTTTPACGDTYRHTKTGADYTIVCVAREESTDRPIVVYRSYVGEWTWTKPLEEFMAGSFKRVCASGSKEEARDITKEALDATKEALDATVRLNQTLQSNIAAALAFVNILREQPRTALPSALVLERLLEHLVRGAEASLGVQTTLINCLGAKSPSARPQLEDLRLDQLSTPASRTLLAMLQECLVLAQELDVERGWVDEEGRGIGWAQTIGAWELGLRREVEGAAGSGLE